MLMSELPYPYEAEFFETIVKHAYTKMWGHKYKLH
jgi:hypothetical protein